MWNLVICIRARYCEYNQMKEDWIRGAFGTHGGEKCLPHFGGKTCRKESLGRLGHRWQYIEMECQRGWEGGTGFIGVGTGTSDWLLVINLKDL